MLNFKELTLDDKDIINSYLRRGKYYICEYSFTTLYIWRKAWNITWCIYLDTLIVKKSYAADGTYFMQPIGYAPENLGAIVTELISYHNENNMDFLFRNLEESFLSELKQHLPEELSEFGIEANNFDYIYESDKLIHLAGRKLASKRNHYSRFVNNYHYRVEEISVQNAQECIEASRKWCQENGCDGFLSYEMKSIVDMLSNLSILSFHGIVVYVDDQVAAFTIGEIANDEMAIIHIEKAFTNYHGLYAFINRTFAEMYFSEVSLINREDDMGLLGLRKAKQSYYPLRLEYKHTAKLRK